MKTLKRTDISRNNCKGLLTLIGTTDKLLVDAGNGNRKVTIGRISLDGHKSHSITHSELKNGLTVQAIAILVEKHGCVAIKHRFSTVFYIHDIPCVS